MDLIEKCIWEILPDLDSTIFCRLIEKLKVIGVKTQEDLPLVEQADISDVLTPIEVRKLIKAWNQGEKVVDPCSTLSRTFSSASGFSSEVASVTSDSDTSFASTTSAGDLGWLINFEIPWNDFPKPVITACEKGLQPDPLLLNEMKRVLVDSILKVVYHKPTKKEMEAIAIKVVTKYPKSFQDSIAGISLGRGYESLATALYDRSNYITKRRRSLQDDVEKKCNKRKESYECSAANWDPNIPAMQQNIDEQFWLQNEHKKSVQEKEKIKELMASTYPLQQKVINDKISVADMKKDWPFFFEETFLLRHYDILVGQSSEKLLQAIQTRSCIILDALENSSCIAVQKKLQQISSECECCNTALPKTVRILDVVCAFFGEDINYLYKCYVENESMETILQSVPTTPFLIVFDSLISPTKVVVCIEKEPVCKMDRVLRGIVYAFCSYYVFNMEYNSKIIALLEFVQRYYAIIEEVGSKTKKRKRHEINPKVVKLSKLVKSHQTAAAKRL